jgi:hypothetical protein
MKAQPLPRRETVCKSLKRVTYLVFNTVFNHEDNPLSIAFEDFDVTAGVGSIFYGVHNSTPLTVEVMHREISYCFG